MERRRCLAVAAAVLLGILPNASALPTKGRKLVQIGKKESEALTCKDYCYSNEHAKVPWQSNDVASYAKCRWSNCKECKECSAVPQVAPKSKPGAKNNAPKQAPRQANLKNLKAKNKQLKKQAQNLLARSKSGVEEESKSDKANTTKASRLEDLESKLKRLSPEGRKKVAASAAAALAKMAHPKAPTVAAAELEEMEKAAAWGGRGNAEKEDALFEAVLLKAEDVRNLSSKAAQLAEPAKPAETSEKEAERIAEAEQIAKLKQQATALKAGSTLANEIASQETRRGACEVWCAKHDAPWTAKCSWNTRTCSTCKGCPTPKRPKPSGPSTPYLDSPSDCKDDPCTGPSRRRKPSGPSSPYLDSPSDSHDKEDHLKAQLWTPPNVMETEQGQRASLMLMHAEPLKEAAKEAAPTNAENNLAVANTLLDEAKKTEEVAKKEELAAPATLAESKEDVELALKEQHLNTKYDEAARAADIISQSSEQVEALATAEVESHVSNVFQAIGSQITKLKDRIGGIKEGYNKQFEMEKSRLGLLVEMQQVNNTNLHQENEKLTSQAEATQKKVAELRAHAEETRSQDERLQFALDSMKANLTMVAEYVDTSDLDDSQATETEVLREMAQRREEHQEDNARSMELREIAGRGKKAKSSMMQVDAHTTKQDKKRAVEFNGSLKDLQDTVKTLQQEHAERMKNLRDLSNKRLNSKVEQYEALMAERQGIQNRISALEETHERLASASEHLEAARKDLQQRWDSVKGYTGLLAASATPAPIGPNAPLAHQPLDQSS